MINPTRREILELLGRASESAPEVRFGQMVSMLPYLGVGPTVESVWEIEDEPLLEALRQHVADLSRRQQQVV